MFHTNPASYSDATVDYRGVTLVACCTAFTGKTTPIYTVPASSGWVISMTTIINKDGCWYCGHSVVSRPSNRPLLLDYIATGATVEGANNSYASLSIAYDSDKNTQTMKLQFIDNDNIATPQSGGKSLALVIAVLTPHTD